jgi:hypothetical protein
MPPKHTPPPHHHPPLNTNTQGQQRSSQVPAAAAAARLVADEQVAGALPLKLVGVRPEGFVAHNHDLGAGEGAGVEAVGKHKVREPPQRTLSSTSPWASLRQGPSGPSARLAGACSAPAEAQAAAAAEQTW